MTEKEAKILFSNIIKEKVTLIQNQLNHSMRRLKQREERFFFPEHTKYQIHKTQTLVKVSGQVSKQSLKNQILTCSPVLAKRVVKNPEKIENKPTTKTQKKTKAKMTLK